MRPSRLRRGAVAVVVLLVVLSLLPGLSAAQSGISGSTVIEEGETVSEVSAVSGSIIVHGTVTGDVSGTAGNVLITGTVEGDVSVATGNLRISGHVGGDVSAGAGSVTLEEDGTVAGNVDIGAGTVRIDGSIDGDARIGAESIHLGEAASIAGSLTYDGRLDGNQDAVAGDITRDRTLGPTTITQVQPLASWVLSTYAFLANLLLGAALLVLFPRFSAGVADRVAAEPVKTALAGLGVLVAVPILLIALLVTIIGIPLALAGLFVFLFVIWVALVYGRFALGMWLLSPGMRNRLGIDADDGERVGPVDRKWAALVLGLALGWLFTLVPVLGGLINFVIFLLGLGALAYGLYRRRNRTTPSESGPQPSPSG